MPKRKWNNCSKKMSKHAQVVIVCVCGVVYVCMCAKWLWSIPLKNHLYLFVASHRATPKPISLMWSEKGYTSCCQHTTLLASVSKSYGRSNGFAAFHSWVVPPWETEKIYFVTRNFWPETMHIWHVCTDESVFYHMYCVCLYKLLRETRRKLSVTLISLILFI